MVLRGGESLLQLLFQKHLKHIFAADLGPEISYLNPTLNLYRMSTYPNPVPPVTLSDPAEGPSSARSLRPSAAGTARV